MKPHVTTHLRAAFAGLGWVDLRAFLDEVSWCAVDACVRPAELPWTKDQFDTLCHRVRGDLPEVAARAAESAAGLVQRAHSTLARLDQMTADALADSVADASAHLRRLVRPGAIGAAGLARLGDLARYVDAVAWRVERMGEDPAKDRRRMTAVRPLEQRYRALVGTLADAADAVQLSKLGWQLEERRVHEFAQPLARKGGWSATRLAAALDRLEGLGP